MPWFYSIVCARRQARVYQTAMTEKRSSKAHHDETGSRDIVPYHEAISLAMSRLAMES